MAESDKAKADESEHDEEEEKEKGEEDAREVGDGHVVDEENEGIGDDAGREDSPVSSGSTAVDEDREDSPVSSGSNTSKNEDDQEKAKEGTSNTSNDGTAASREDSVAEEDEKAKEGGSHSSNTTEKPKKLAKKKRKQHSVAEKDEEAKEDGDQPKKKMKRKQHDVGKSTTVKTPTNMHGRRRVPPKTAVAFVVDKPLSCEESLNLCQHIHEKHNDEVVFTVGGTEMTGAELMKCRDDAESSLNIVDAFIECLKCDDKKNGIEKTRIILQRQH